MVEITKDMAEYLRRRMPNVCISKTMKQKSSKGKYYAEETAAVLKAISQYESEINVISEYPNSK